MEGFDTNKDGIIDKAERKKNKKRVLSAFDEEMPEEHVNDYADVYVYRPKLDQVPDRDTMDISFDASGQDQLPDDGKGIPVREGYSLFDSSEEKKEKLKEERRRQREQELGDGEYDGEEDNGRPERDEEGEEDDNGRPEEEDDENRGQDRYPGRDDRDEL